MNADERRKIKAVQGFMPITHKVNEIDRVGLTGLRPSVLPHHRTCGFPHTAVESGKLNLTVNSRVPIEGRSHHGHSLRCVSRSITPPLRLDGQPRHPGENPLIAVRSAARVAAAVAAPLAFRPPSRLSPWARCGPRSRDSSFLRSARLSASLFTTTNCADFSPTLVAEISPGKMHVLSTRAAKLYRRCLSVTVGFRVS